MYIYPVGKGDGKRKGKRLDLRIPSSGLIVSLALALRAYVDGFDRALLAKAIMTSKQSTGNYSAQLRSPDHPTHIPGMDSNMMLSRRQRVLPYRA